jgi:hypothetical protein
VNREPGSYRSDRITGGVHEHPGSVDVHVAAWISQDREDLAG